MKSASPVIYANWWSKLLFAKSFANQFPVPLPNPPALDRFMEWAEKQFFSVGHQGLAIEKPVFIVGLPRSGTTVLYNLLCAHERAAYVTNSMNSFPRAIRTIEWARKRFHFDVRGERFLQDSVDTDFGSPSEPLLHWGRWFGRDAQSLEWKPIRGADLPPGRIEEIHDDVRRVIAAFGGSDRRFITKYVLAQTELALIRDVFPDAVFVHIVRDGRMVANSLIKLHRLVNEQLRRIRHPGFTEMIAYPRIPGLGDYLAEFGPEDLKCTARVWRDSTRMIRETGQALGRFLEIRHEDLLADARGALARVFEHCELEWPRSRAFESELARHGKLRHENRYGGFEIVEAIAGDELRRYGYLS